MDLRLTPEEEAFRDEARAWLSANPPGERPADEEATYHWRRDWQVRLHQAGYVGLAWPADYGGRGATPVEQALLYDELHRAGAPRLINDVGLLLAGPMIVAHGTPQQKQRYLERILTSEEIWCQGFSEPAAGSDLAALTARATPTDGGWKVSGQKVWTSYAAHARRCLLLARTGSREERHRGLTLFLMDMQQPGIEVRPLRQITGDAEFNELFLDEVFVADEDVLGAVGGGWPVAMATLQEERAMHSTTIWVRSLLTQALADLHEVGALEDADARQRVGRLCIDMEIVRLNGLRIITSACCDDVAPGAEVELHKWQLSEAYTDVTELVTDLLGETALTAASPWGHEWLHSYALAIASGTNEILQNVLATRILGLPRGA